MNPFAGSHSYSRLGNAFTRRLWSLLGAPEGYCILTVTGRKSGKRHVVSIRAIREGNRIVAAAMYGERTLWLKNIRAKPRVTIKLGRRTVEGTARAAVDEAETQWAAKLYKDSVAPGDCFDYVGLHWGIPTKSKIKRTYAKIYDEGTPVIIDLEGEEP